MADDESPENNQNNKSLDTILEKSGNYTLSGSSPSNAQFEKFF